MTAVGNSYAASLRAHYDEVKRRLGCKPRARVNMLPTIKQAEELSYRDKLLAGLPSKQTRLWPGMTDDQVEAIFTVLDSSGVTWPQVASGSREVRILTPRRIIMALMRSWGFRMREIGEALHVDHSTVSQTFKRYEDAIVTNPVFLRAQNCVKRN